MISVRYDKIKILLLAALVIGCCLRLTLALVMDNKISWEDERDYLDLSQRITNGEGYVRADGSPTAFRAAGYPFFLALLRVIGVQSPAGIRIVQALLGTGIIWLVYRLGLIVFDRKTGLLSAILIAVYPYYIFMPGTILAETLFTTLILSASLLLFLALRDGKGKLYIFSAFIMAAAVLTRPAALALVMGVAVWLIMVARFPVKKRIGIAALFVITVLLAIAPWMSRNYMKLDSFSVATNGGRNFWLGNNPEATINSGSNIEMDELMQRKIDSAATEIQTEKIYYALAWQFIKADPRQFATRIIKKGLAFWRWSPSPMSQNSYARETLIKWLSIVSVGPVFILAVLGYIMASAELRSKISLWFIFALFYTVVHALYISKVRFRLPLDAFMILIAAFAIMRLYGQFRNAAVKGTV